MWLHYVFPMPLTASAILIFICQLVCIVSGFSQNVESHAWSKIQELRGFSDEKLQAKPQVQVRGTVTFHDPASRLTYLQDEQGGIELLDMPDTVIWELGQQLELTGTVDSTRPIPALRVNADSIVIKGKSRVPDAVPLSNDLLRIGSLDGRRVSMDASIFRMELTTERGSSPWLRANVATPSGHFTWLIPWQVGRAFPSELLHAKVHCVCICEAIYNNRGQRIGNLFFVANPSDIAIIRAPRKDPFDRPSRSLAELGRAGLDDPFDRVRLEGSVLCQQHREKMTLVHLRTKQGATQVEIGSGNFAIGDRIAVVGYPVLANKHVILTEAIAKKLGDGEDPPPLVMSIDELLRAGSDSDLVRIQANVIRNGLEATSGSLFVESSGKVVEIILSDSFDQTMRINLASRLAPATAVAITGVAELRGMMLTSGTVTLTDMRLTLRTPTDIQVLRAPPWWTSGRLLRLTAALAAILALGSAWLFLLKRRVTMQTEIIREKVGRETRWIERSRIARDIHDDVGSALTQITLLGDLGNRSECDPQRVEDLFMRISRQAREAVRALDAIVWTVNPKNDSLDVTISYLCQTIQDLARDAGIRCRLEIPDEIPEVVLGTMLRHNLLLATKEAVHNVIKHANASILRLRMECGETMLRLEVSDDGVGFRYDSLSSSRTGLDSMRQRMNVLSGTLEIKSDADHGTTVVFILPWNIPS